MRSVETIAAREVPRLLEQWLGRAVDVRREVDGIDLLVRSDDATLLVEVKGSDEIASQEQAVRQLQAYTGTHAGAVAVLVVPCMGRKGREHAEAKELSWMDLTGNADIRGPGLRVLVEGKPNRFASPGRPSTAFTPSSARVARVMLVEPERWWLHKELTEATRLSGGYVSKVVGRLLDDELVERRPTDGCVRPGSPSTLLDAWAQVYDFARHEIGRFHLVGRSGTEVLDALAGRLRQSGTDWAATGLAAGWQWSRFADFRLATFLPFAQSMATALGSTPSFTGMSYRTRIFFAKR